MKLAIQVEGHPASSLAAHSAYQFIKAALANKHEIILVFFYYDAVFCGMSPGIDSPADSASATPWSLLAREGRLDLVLCSAALERRGLCEQTDGPGRVGIDSRLREGFRIGGLSQWVDACLRSDRHVTFAP